ncbi:MAG: carboxypeptidase regulatory-like domain-containing protein [Acidobacteriota bacterium]
MRGKLLALMVIGLGLLFGQGERGTFNGTVTDPTGAVIPGAKVDAVNVATGVETKVETTSAGVFRMPYLPPGTYKLSASATGFKTAIRENVVLAVAQTLTVDFALTVGAVTDQVTVSAETPLLETGTAEIGSYVTKKEFDTWPIAVGDGRRQIQQFIFTALPGTVGGTWEGSINGGQYFSHEILIDGIALGRMDIQGGSNNEFSPSAESVSEFKLQTGTVSAQYTGGQTSVANFATKSGTNELHGSAYYYVQNDGLRANTWNNNAAGMKRTPYKQHNYGYSAGGPVWFPKIYDGRNRTFFFHNFEYTKVRNFTSTGFSRLPTKDQKEGNFARLLSPAYTGDARSGTTAGTDALGRPVVFGAVYDPNSARQVGNTWVRDPFPGNAVPKGRWSPVSQKILDLAPITDPAFDAMLNNIPNLSACCPVFGEKMLTLKGDHNLSSSQRVAVTFNRNFRARNNSPGGRWGLPPGTPTGVYQWQETPGTLGRVAYDWTVRPTVLNHFAMGYNRFGNLNQSVFIDQDWPQKVGYQNLPGTHFPTLTFSGQAYQGGGIGAGGRLGSANAGGAYNGSTIIQDDVTIIRGAHNFKLGFEQRRYFYNTRGRGTESGTFAFSPATSGQPGFASQTGHAFASFLLGAYSSTSRNVVASYFGHRWRSTGFYFMDDWKVNRKLTLNLGMRWEIIGGMFEVARRMSALSFTAANARAGGRPGALVWIDDLGRKSFQDRYWRQLSPKFGFAYAISPKLVMRGGYGINNTPPISNGWGFGGGEGFNSSIARNTGNVALRFAEEPVGLLHDRYLDFAGVLPNKDPSMANGRGANYWAPDSNRLAYVQNWNLGFQYELPQFFVLELNYIGNKGTRLEAQGLDSLNSLPISFLDMGQKLTDPWNAASGIPQPFPGFAGTVLQALRPYPQYTGIGQDFANFGTSLYNGLQVQVTRHFRNGLAILGAYTWSKAIGLASGALGDYSVSAADVFNRRLERSILSYNYPQFFKLTWIYELPIGPNKLVNIPGIAGKIIGGWNVTGNLQVRSGSPISVGGGGISNPLGSARLDLVPGKPIILNSDAPINFRGKVGGTAYLNREAFTLPPVHPGGRNVITRLGTLGPVLPNIRGPHWTSEDLAIDKTWSLGEARSFQIRGTFLNPFNRHGRGGLDTDILSPFFGQLTGQGSGPRNIELSARITF